MKRSGTLLVLLAMMLAALVSGCGGTEDPTVEGDATAAAHSTADAKIGQTLTLKGTSYKVTKAKTASTVGSDYSKEKANGIFIVVNLTLTNKENEPASISSENCRLLGGNGKEYTISDDAMFSVDNPLIFEEIQPDVSKKVVAVYDVPKKAVKGSMLLVQDFWSDSAGTIDLSL